MIRCDKTEMLNRLCYTELVYERINKKLRTQLSKHEIEKMFFNIIQNTNEECFNRRGKNIYVTNSDNNIQVTINANNYRVITVDKIIKTKC